MNTLYVYNKETTALLDTVIGLFENGVISLKDGSTFQVPSGCEISSLEDLSETMVSDFAAAHPTLEQRVATIEARLGAKPVSGV